MILLCILACCNLSGCGRINFIAPEKKMESYLERKYDEENPDIVVTCGYGDNFDDNYRDELFRKQFKELMYEYSSQFLPVSIMSRFPGMRERSQLMKNRPLRNISKMIRDLPSISMLRI